MMHLIFCTPLDTAIKISFVVLSVVPLQITYFYPLQCKIDLDLTMRLSYYSLLCTAKFQPKVVLEGLVMGNFCCVVNFFSITFH